MKKVLLTIALFVGTIQFSNAQISYGLKAGMNIDANGEASKQIEFPAGISLDTKSNNGGFHAGAWLRVKVPIIGLYVRPELIYTDLTSEYTLNITEPNTGITESTGIEYSLTKIDMPVLLGLKFLGVGNVFLGPNVQYLLSSELKSDFSSDDSIDEELSIGLVIGAGVEFWKLGLDVRFETGFVSPQSTTIPTSEDIANIANSLTSQKPNQVIIGLSYKF
tara:strand:+ start:25721 stop:26380 length:660 start_codon:yes stop_codon:yes gene_type:complete